MTNKIFGDDIFQHDRHHTVSQFSGETEQRKRRHEQKLWQCAQMQPIESSDCVDAIQQSHPQLTSTESATHNHVVQNLCSTRILSLSIRRWDL